MQKGPKIVIWAAFSLVALVANANDSPERFLPPKSEALTLDQFRLNLPSQTVQLPVSIPCNLFSGECNQIDSVFLFSDLGGIYLIFEEDTLNSLWLWLATDSNQPRDEWVSIANSSDKLKVSSEIYSIEQGKNCEPDISEHLLKLLVGHEYTLVRQIKKRHRCEGGPVQMGRSNFLALGEGALAADIDLYIYHLGVAK